MKKSVVVLNDDLGTIALGFSKAGYDVRTIYFNHLEANDSSVCRDNWGDIVREERLDYFIQEMSSLSNIECLAGKIIFRGFTTVGRKKNCINENHSISQIEYIIKRTQPKCFIFRCIGINERTFSYTQFCKNVVEMGYEIRIEKIDTRFVTGFPVNEKNSFLIGALHLDDINIELLKNIDTPNYSIDEFLDKQMIEEQYYNINPRYLRDIEREHSDCLLCWSNNHYREEKIIKWNPRMIPMIAKGNRFRRVTHREIARMKGIPDEYLLRIDNKFVMYRKLMYCANVQLIQQIASIIYYDDGEKVYRNREVSKSLQFKKVILSYFEQKGINNILDTKDINTYIDFQYRDGSNVYNFDFRIYHNNVGIESKVVAACKKISEKEIVNGVVYILVVGNIVENETKKHITEKYNVFIWDIENLLWILGEFPQLKSDFVSLLSFNVSDIVPKKPNPEILKLNINNTVKVDLQEELRKIQPGSEEAIGYEELCVKIVKFLFSESIEFDETQKKSNNGLYRFDFCGKIKHGNKSEFFDTVQKFFGTKYIIFEFKNYTEAITQKEIYTTEKYLYEKALRRVAIIISRKGADENAQKASRGSLRELGKLIICLSDEDVNKLINKKNNEEDPADYLEELLDNMLMDLEK